MRLNEPVDVPHLLARLPIDWRIEPPLNKTILRILVLSFQSRSYFRQQ